MGTKIIATAKINKHPKANTFQLNIPADITKHEKFPFKSGELIKLEFDPDTKLITLSKLT